MQYAALDAYCLLMLLDKFLSHAEPAEYPINSNPDERLDMTEAAQQPASEPEPDADHSCNNRNPSAHQSHGNADTLADTQSESPLVLNHVWC